jgi:L-asparaginase II
MTRRGEALLTTTRGSLVETEHYGHIVVTTAQGDILYKKGNAHHVTYFRSAAKPIQALEVILSGAHQQFGFTDAELSIMCASHYGEKYHRETVLSILKKIGLSKNDLKCGKTTSLNNDYATEMALKGYGADELFNDCSGKHAGFLAVCKAKNYDIASYILPDHPLEQQLTKLIGQVCNYSTSEIIIGIDGCGVPVHGIPLFNMALGFANLSKPTETNTIPTEAATIITRAMANHPEMLSGTGGFCTALTKGTNGRLFGKIGAEAVYCVGNTETGQGLAIKLTDGNLWKLAPIVMQTLEKLNWLHNDEITELQEFRRIANKNKHGNIVGYTEAID